MNNFYFFDMLPLWASYIGIVVIILVSAWSGILLAQWRKKRIKNEEDSSINTIVGATLALLAFILAFTFGMTNTRFDARKKYQLEEVNAIETAYLRADLINEPYQSKIKSFLKEYVNIRVQIVRNPEKLQEYIRKSELMHKEIWAIVTKMTQNEAHDNQLNALLIESINQVFDYHTLRVTVSLTERIPAVFWFILIVLIILSMFEVGYLVGKMNKPNWYMVLALSFAFSGVIILIVVLDSTNGIVQVDHQVMFDLHERLLNN